MRILHNLAALTGFQAGQDYLYRLEIAWRWLALVGAGKVYFCARREAPPPIGAVRSNAPRQYDERSDTCLFKNLFQ